MGCDHPAAERIEVSSAESQAIVVGIEKYDIAPTWNLDGPAVDAARFVRWLRSRGVPAKNIALFVSPLSRNQREIDSLDVFAQAADHKTIMEWINGELAKRTREQLLMMWGGHGVMSEGTRRLFFSDVRENYLLSLQFDDLMRLLRSTTNPGTNKQAVFVDVCANYFELMQSPAALAEVPVVPGLPRLNVSQFVMLGAGAGERAKNLDAIHSGLFSSNLLDELEKEPASAWPPDFEAVKTRVEKRMATLRAEGKAKQTPAYYYYQNGMGGEGTFESASVAPAPHAILNLIVTDRDRLVEALLQCRVMQTEKRRDAVVSDLRPAIANDVERDPAARFDAIAIVKTCARFRGGLSELINRVKFYEQETAAGAELSATAEGLRLEEM
jgi:hypothetical protein